MLNRRELLQRAAQWSAVAAMAPAWAVADVVSQGAMVNDSQSLLNPTLVRGIVRPGTIDEVTTKVLEAARERRQLCVSGGRHAMGGQQFATDDWLIDLRGLNKIGRLDTERGTVEVEAGVEWPALIEELNKRQAESPQVWTIRQKQSGVDEVTLGGYLASNIHGRGMRYKPLVSDIESFTLVDAAGQVRTCSRRENAELFSLAIGGYGLFGIVTAVTLKLVPRQKLKRIVQVIAVKDFLPAVEQRLGEGFVFGDCQYATNLDSDAEAHPGVFAAYHPVPDETPLTPKPKQLTKQQWTDLYRLARTDKKRAFEVFSGFYLATSGQVYCSDLCQLSGTLAYYHDGVKLLPPEQRGTEVITEIYVPHEQLMPFLATAREDFVRHNVDPTYGTIRLIERDDETFLAWARERSVCIICNLHVVHTAAGKQKAADDFRRIIDRAIQHRGRYYLTYHRHATRKQVEACYPQFVDFLRLKKKYDPQEVFQSDWYRHYKRMFADRV